MQGSYIISFKNLPFDIKTKLKELGAEIEFEAEFTEKEIPESYQTIEITIPSDEEKPLNYQDADLPDCIMDDCYELGIVTRLTTIHPNTDKYMAVYSMTHNKNLAKGTAAEMGFTKIGTTFDNDSEDTGDDSAAHHRITLALPENVVHAIKKL
jgi:hypothetical protein